MTRTRPVPAAAARGERDESPPASTARASAPATHARHRLLVAGRRRIGIDGGKHLHAQRLLQQHRRRERVDVALSVRACCRPSRGSRAARSPWCSVRRAAPREAPCAARARPPRGGTRSQRGVSSPSPSSGSPITMPRASSASARRTSSAIGGRLPARRYDRHPPGDAIVPDGSLIASPMRRSPQSMAIQRPRSDGIIGTDSPLAHLHEELSLFFERDICLSRNSIASASGMSARKVRSR